MRRVVVFLAFRQLWARRGLNGLAVLGVLLGVLVLVTISGILRGFHQKFLNNIIKISPHVVVFDRRIDREPPLLSRHFPGLIAASVAHDAPSERNLRIQRPAEVLRVVRALPGVEAAAGSLWGSALVAFGARRESVDLRGIEPSAADEVTPIASYIVDGSFQEIAQRREGVLLGVGVAQRLGVHAGDSVSLGTPNGRTLKLKVVGVFDAGIPPVDNHRAYVVLKQAEQVLARPDTVARIEVRLQDPERAVQVAQELEGLLGYDAESWQETNSNFLAIFKQQSVIIGFVIAAILAVGGFGILAVQIMIVLQKTRDIAILRSVGFGRGDILGLFLLQGAVIAALGAALGDVGGHYLLQALGRLKIHAEGMVRSDTFMVHDDPRNYWYGAAFALLVGLIASLVPALRASRLEPVDVLRGQIG